MRIGKWDGIDTWVSAATLLSVERFGFRSHRVIMQEYGFTAENVCKRRLALLQ